MGTSKSRREKQAWIELILNVALEREKEPLSKKRLLAEFVLQMKATRKTGLEILRAMEDAGRIKIIGDEIWSVKND